MSPRPIVAATFLGSISSAFLKLEAAFVVSPDASCCAPRFAKNSAFFSGVAPSLDGESPGVSSYGSVGPSPMPVGFGGSFGAGAVPVTVVVPVVVVPVVVVPVVVVPVVVVPLESPPPGRRNVGSSPPSTKPRLRLGLVVLVEPLLAVVVLVSLGGVAVVAGLVSFGGSFGASA